MRVLPHNPDSTAIDLLPEVVLRQSDAAGAPKHGLRDECRTRAGECRVVDEIGVRRKVKVVREVGGRLY